MDNRRKLQEGRYRYYLPMRPPSIGTQPRGQKAVCSFEARMPIDTLGREAWGWVEYDHPLTTREQSDYELIPSPLNPYRQPEG